jgi:hypothetical protein
MGVCIVCERVLVEHTETQVEQTTQGRRHDLLLTQYTFIPAPGHVFERDILCRHVRPFLHMRVPVVVQKGDLYV